MSMERIDNDLTRDERLRVFRRARPFVQSAVENQSKDYVRESMTNLLADHSAPIRCGVIERDGAWWMEFGWPLPTGITAWFAKVDVRSVGIDPTGDRWTYVPDPLVDDDGSV
jgi:hypothetical protein